MLSREVRRRYARPALRGVGGAARPHLLRSGADRYDSERRPRPAGALGGLPRASGGAGGRSRPLRPGVGGACALSVERVRHRHPQSEAGDSGHLVGPLRQLVQGRARCGDPQRNLGLSRPGQSGTGGEVHARGRDGRPRRRRGQCGGVPRRAGKRRLRRE